VKIIVTEAAAWDPAVQESSTTNSEDQIDMMHVEVAPDLNTVTLTGKPQHASNPRAALEELFILLEEYGPMWYTQEHHDRALNALLGRED
jgi:hypothetical protein